MALAAVYFDTTNPDGFLEAIGGTGDLFENVQGFNGFQLCGGIKDTNRFLLTVDWDSVEDHQARQAAHVEGFLGAVGPHIEGLPDIKHFA